MATATRFRNILQLFVNPMIMVAKVSTVGTKPAFGQTEACWLSPDPVLY